MKSIYPISCQIQKATPFGTAWVMAARSVVAEAREPASHVRIVVRGRFAR